MGWEEKRQGPRVALDRAPSTPLVVESVDDPWAPTPPDTEPSAAGLTEGAPLLSRFQVLRPLGAGGQGRVFAAIDRAAGERRVALKVMPRRGDRAAEQRLLDEFVIMRRVRHPCGSRSSSSRAATSTAPTSIARSASRRACA
jgi:hypothetical protein